MRTRFFRCRLFSIRIVLCLLLVLAFGASCYYYKATVEIEKPGSKDFPSEGFEYKPQSDFYQEHHAEESNDQDVCPLVQNSRADIDTSSVYPTFDFQPGWVRSREFWGQKFEARYEMLKNDSNRYRLKVILVPHSHNDPGWLKTFEQYFEWKTKNIINNMIQKLHQYPNMTFIWTEISFLNAWWDRAHPIKQKALKKLVLEGRLEITTGGWVMPDEACTHIYSLIDQFIEGHNWVKSNLGITPKTGWSIDPFGHGATVPYILDKSGLDGAIIQRIHYAWKQWFAQHQIEEFHWIPGWSTKKTALIVHNQPFDIYSIKSSCGPHPSICLSYDFRPGELSEYNADFEEITDQNLHKKSKTLVDEYHRIGSLTPHNVVLVPLGDDFRYEYSTEFDAQYANYMKMFNYINSHKELFNAEVQFGTPLDYFNAVKERHENIPTLKGDFFVYSDIFSEGKPAYWSGYYTTRPYLKILARQLEHQLRSAEILFSLVFNHIKQSNDPKFRGAEKKLEKLYEELIYARRNLGLFQHHDAITGTSKAAVMYDYGTKMFTSLYHCIRLQETALTAIMLPNNKLHTQSIIQSETEWETYGKPVRKLHVSLIDKNKVILFNPLAEDRVEIITLRTNTTNLRVYDTRKKEHVHYQISPSIKVKGDGRRVLSDTSFDLVFVASVPALSSVTFNLEAYTNTSNHCNVFCNNCANTKTGSKKPEIFVTKNMMSGDIQLENSVLKLLVNKNNGFLRQIFRKDVGKKNVVEMQFGAYQSAQRHSGAYLFMPDFEAPEKQVLNSYSNFNNLADDNIIIVSGPVSTEITTMYIPFLIHTVTIYNVEDPALSRAILIENIVDFENPPTNRDTELFMRIQTDIQNGDIPEFFTDQNGFQYQKRMKVEKLGIEANYYPITTMAWIQDDDTRLTVITNHAQGAAAFEPGRLEVMLDRRTLYDDFRGMGEGIVDNKQTHFQHWLLLEPMTPTVPKTEDTSKKTDNDQERKFNTESKDGIYQLPSDTADYLSRTMNYPVNVFLVDTSEVGTVEVKTHHSFVKGFPTGIHLVTIRTISDDILEQSPSKSCYVVLHRPGLSCSVADKYRNRGNNFKNTTFKGVEIKNITAVSLTGLQTYGAVPQLRDIYVEPMEMLTYKMGF